MVEIWSAYVPDNLKTVKFTSIKTQILKITQIHKQILLKTKKRKKIESKKIDAINKYSTRGIEKQEKDQQIANTENEEWEATKLTKTTRENMIHTKNETLSMKITSTQRTTSQKTQKSLKRTTANIKKMNKI